MAASVMELEFATEKPSGDDLVRLQVNIPAGAKSLVMENVKHAEVHPDPGQPRVNVDADLWRSIATNGILQPITVRPCPAVPELKLLPAAASDDERRRRVRATTTCLHCARSWAEIHEAGEFMIVDGERRWRASADVMPVIPVIVRVDQEQRGRRLLTQAAANTGKPLAPIEEAELYQEALDGDDTLTHAMVAAIVGKSRSSVTDRLALLKNAAWVPLLRAGEITVSQALEVSRYADAYPEVHEAAIEYLRAPGRLDAGERLADMELVYFKQLLERAYADPTELPVEPEPVASKTVSRGEHADEGEQSEDEQGSSATTRDSRAEEHVGHNEQDNGRHASPRVDDGAQSASSRGSVVAARQPAGLFTQLMPLIAERAVNMTIAPGRSAGSLRVNVIPQVLKKGESAALSTPLSVEGTPEDIDEGLAEAIASFLEKRATLAVSVPVAETETAAAETKGKPASRAPKKKPAATAKKKPAAKASQKQPVVEAPSEPAEELESTSTPAEDAAQLDILSQTTTEAASAAADGAES